MASNSEEPMDLDPTDSRVPLPRADWAPGELSDDPQALALKEPGPQTGPQPGATGRSSIPPEQGQSDEDVAELTVSLTVTEVVDPKKFKNSISKTLQSWANKNGVKGEFTATEISEDVKTAVIRVKPAAALSELLQLRGRELITKEHKTFSFFFENDVNKTSQIDQKSSGKSSPNLSKEDHMKSQESSAEDDNINHCLVALGPYWYVKNVYPDKIQRIEREHGVKITENVDVSIKADKKRSDLKKATDEFTKLVQSSQCSGVSIPLKNISPEEWKETLKSLQTTDHRCQITISSDQITIFGPQQFQTAISKSLQRVKISTNLTDEEREMSKKYPTYDERKCKTLTRNKVKLSSSIKDPLVIDGLPVERFYWQMMTNQHKEELDRIKEKFNVRFKEAEPTQDTMRILVRYNRSEGNVHMESHAARALLRLYQKVAALQFMRNIGPFEDAGDGLHSPFDEFKGAAGKMDTPKEKSSKGYTEGGAVKKPSGAGDKKDEKEEENCPVCLDTFTNKTRLKCNHEFCKECLEQSIKSQGPVCPVCKDVFGLVEGIQPPGSMKWHTSIASLPGYEGCGRIDIHYHIPSGTQTAKHPNPGQRYQGLDRQAYLPDNREGNEVLRLLKKAFDQKLIFTVGTSRTTGAENMVTWNDIHHKTSPYGGPQSFGYPDPNYLSRVKEELKANGIK
ncbi:uncharacterized protein [Eucyclogobius newberryi]|uniref:uncharacterized protein n=1 Tax=Eucyclogobius newberryi TaxID=166745 RepID=UPI003B5B02CB